MAAAETIKPKLQNRIINNGKFIVRGEGETKRRRDEEKKRKPKWSKGNERNQSDKYEKSIGLRRIGLLFLLIKTLQSTGCDSGMQIWAVTCYLTVEYTND